MKELRGRVAVITGGGSGIGRGTALAMAEAGMRVAVVDINTERAGSVAQEIEGLGGEALPFVCDATSDADLERLLAATRDRFGAVNLLMNNIGVVPSGRFADIPLGEWQRAFEVNLLAYVRAIRVFVPELLTAGDAHIVNTASTAGLYPYTADRLPYSTTKAAVVSLSEGLALELEPQGIGITCLCPGPVRTNILEQMSFHSGKPEFKTPTLSFLEPEEVGRQVVDAVRGNVFFLPTNAEVFDILRRRAANPDGFLREQAAAFVVKT